MKEKLQKVISNYNELFSPEATASLEKLENNTLWVIFRGPFCKTCGLSDYFGDFIIQAQNENLLLSLKDYKKVSEDSYLVKFERR